MCDVPNAYATPNRDTTRYADAASHRDPMRELRYSYAVPQRDTACDTYAPRNAMRDVCHAYAASYRDATRDAYAAPDRNAMRELRDAYTASHWDATRDAYAAPDRNSMCDVCHAHAASHRDATRHAASASAYTCTHGNAHGRHSAFEHFDPLARRGRTKCCHWRLHDYRRFAQDCRHSWNGPVVADEQHAFRSNFGASKLG